MVLHKALLPLPSLNSYDVFNFKRSNCYTFFFINIGVLREHSMWGPEVCPNLQAHLQFYSAASTDLCHSKRACTVTVHLLTQDVSQNLVKDKRSKTANEPSMLATQV